MPHISPLYSLPFTIKFIPYVRIEINGVNAVAIIDTGYLENNKIYITKNISMATIPEVLQRFKSWRLLELKKDQLLKRWRSSGIGTIDQPLYVKENRLKIVDKVKMIGADVSWMSSWLAKKAGFEHAIDKQYQTELSGVGGLVKTRGHIKCEFEPSTAEISRYFFSNK